MSFGQHGEQGMMAGSSVLAWIVTFQRTFLLAVALKDGRIKIETITLSCSEHRLHIKLRISG